MPEGDPRAGEQLNAVSPYELAVLVLHFLESSGYRRSAVAFKKEAREQLASAVTALPAGVKTLGQVLNEYVAVKEKDARRTALHAANPLAASLYSLLDHHAGLSVPLTLPPAFYGLGGSAGSGAATGGALPQGMHDQACAADGAALSQQHRHHHHQQQDAVYDAYHQQQRQSASTPGRHGPRKGAVPRKRRRLEEALAGRGGGEGGGGSCQHPDHPAAAAFEPGTHPDLLNMQLDEDALACLLEDGKTQLTFADTLAQSINARMAAVAGHGGGSSNGGSGGHCGGGGGHAGDCRTAMPEEGSLDGLLLSVDELLANLPADPQLAPLLQQVVRGTDGPASPPFASAQVGSRRMAKQHDAAAEAVDKLAREEPETGSRQQQQQQGHMTIRLEEAAKEQQREDQQAFGGGSAGAGASASLAPAAAPQPPLTTTRDKENLGGGSMQQRQVPAPQVTLLLPSVGNGCADPKAASRSAAVGGAVAAPLAPAALVAARALAPTTGVMAQPASLQVPPLAAGTKPGGAQVIKLSCRRELEAVLGGVAEVAFDEADALIDDDLLGDP